MSDLVIARNCCMARMLPGEAENGLPGEEIVKRFERSNGLDTALYKNYLYLYTCPLLLSKRLQSPPFQLLSCRLTVVNPCFRPVLQQLDLSNFTWLL